MKQYQRIRSGFNFLAPVYDFLSTVFSFNSIHRSQTWALTKPLKYSNALIVGGGTGRFLVELIKNNPTARYCYADISDKMIALAKSKVRKQFQNAGQVQFFCGSYTEIPANEKFDLIVTNYFLDCFTDAELPEVVNSLHKHLTPDGAWLFTDFNIPEKGGNKLFSSAITRLLYWGFNIVCGLGVKQLPDFKTAFAESGYTPIHEKYFFGGLLSGRIYKNKQPVTR